MLLQTTVIGKATYYVIRRGIGIYVSRRDKAGRDRRVGFFKTYGKVAEFLDCERYLVAKLAAAYAAVA